MRTKVCDRAAVGFLAVMVVVAISGVGFVLGWATCWGLGS